MMHAGIPESFTAPKWLLAFAALVLIEIALLALAARCVGHSRLGLLKRPRRRSNSVPTDLWYHYRRSQHAAMPAAPSRT